MLSVYMKRAVAFIQPDVAAAGPVIGTAFHMSPESVKVVLLFHGVDITSPSSKSMDLLQPLGVNPGGGAGQIHDCGVVPLQAPPGIGLSKDSGAIFVAEPLTDRVRTKTPG